MPAQILVLAGVNGAGKSSVAGAAIREAGGVYYNPDEATRQIRTANPGLAEPEANARAWKQGKRLLERAISLKGNFSFETTLGGNAITRLLGEALDAGLDVRVKYVGLATPELHVRRVRQRVARGGHDIPESRIRERYESSRLNLIRLLPRLTELYVYDNSEEAPPEGGRLPAPVLLLHVVGGRVEWMLTGNAMPTWAKPIAMAALKVSR